MTEINPQNLSALEQNALRWVLLCERYHLDPLEADALQIEAVVLERGHKRDATRTGRRS